jgi:hypothetical protein
MTVTAPSAAPYTEDDAADRLQDWFDLHDDCCSGYREKLDHEHEDAADIDAAVPVKLAAPLVEILTLLARLDDGGSTLGAWPAVARDGARWRRLIAAMYVEETDRVYYVIAPAGRQVLVDHCHAMAASA